MRYQFRHVRGVFWAKTAVTICKHPANDSEHPFETDILTRHLLLPSSQQYFTLILQPAIPFLLSVQVFTIHANFEPSMVPVLGLRTIHFFFVTIMCSVIGNEDEVNGKPMGFFEQKLRQLFGERRVDVLLQFLLIL
jgi:hypothetical protein